MNYSANMPIAWQIQLRSNNMFAGAKGLILAHIQECEANRRAADEQFSRLAAKTDKLETKLDKLEERREQQHAENLASFSEIRRIIYLGAGGVGLLAFLTSSWGTGLLELLRDMHHG